MKWSHPRELVRLAALGCFLAILLSQLCGCGSGNSTQSLPQVKTQTQLVTNRYHGTAVVDAYQWLENGTDPAVRKWSSQQNAKARAYLDKSPTRPVIEDRLTRLLSAPSTNFYSLTWRRGQFFMLKFQPPAQQPVLIRMSNLTNLASQPLVLDPNVLSTNGTHSIDWYEPSPDGSLVAVSISENGSEEGTLYFYETATGLPKQDAIPRVQAPTAGGSAAWNADSTGLYYTRYPRKGERAPQDLAFYQQVYFHTLGTPLDQDRYEIGKDFPRIAEIQLKSSPDGERILATVANGDGGEFAHYIRDPNGQWTQIAGFDDKILKAEFGRNPLYVEWGSDESVYLLSRKDAPRGKILRLPLSSLDLTNAQTIFADRTNVIQDFRPAASGLAVALANGGPSEFAYLDYFENTIRNAHGKDKTPETAQEMVVVQGDEILFRVESFIEPYSWWRYNPTKSKETIEPLPLKGHSPVSFDDVEVAREFVPSKDGTEIPLNIIRRRGTHIDGTNPTLLTGYGGYGISLGPEFDVSRKVWLEQGGVIAIANLRGGGEYGETWHQAGCLTNKQNVFDDFAACAQFLVRSNYTTAEKLAIEGGSNGGLLMGATLTQHPEIAGTVVSHVGIYDMLRVELDPNGAFNVTEFGSVKSPEQFKALYAYSPFHQVKDKTKYPAVLMLTGDTDGRVNPAHSRKMIARLQAASASTKPILLRTSSNSGHGIGTALSEHIQQLADVYTFLFEQLGIEFSQIDRGPWSGATTPSSIVVKAKLIREGLPARLLISEDPKLSKNLKTEPVGSETNHHDVVEFLAENLKPDTQYYYALEVAGRVDHRKTGAFKTFPAPGPASFTIAFASCAKTASVSDVFDRIRENHPLFYMNMGDFHYLNIAVNDRERFRAAYDTVLGSIQQAELYRNIPFVYVWDDHDFGGNRSDKRAKSEEAARTVYEEYVPHYPLPFTENHEPISQAFSVGRVRFILTDLRSQRDDASKWEGGNKTMLGAKQKEWFKKELLAANGKYPLICWMSTDPWIGAGGTNYYHWVKTNQYGYFHHTNHVETPSARPDRNVGRVDDDSWAVYRTERREIANFIKENHISGVCILHGDSHMLAADDGSHSDYASGGGAPLPVMCAAPLDQEPSLKGGYYSQGVYRMHKGEGGFGLLTVMDKGGSSIDVAFSGRNNKNEEKISLKFSVPVLSAQPGAQN